MQNLLFLSYRSSDRPAAVRIGADLKNAGLPVWMDCLDQGIRVGDDWSIVVQRRLDTSRGLIALISPGYVQSRNCLDELRRARELEKPIFPLVIEPLATREEWPLEIQRTRYLDLSSWHSEALYLPRLEEFIEDVYQSFQLPERRVPDPETKFLTSLLAELEASRGVLEYVDIAADVDAASHRPVPVDEWGFDVLLKISSKKDTQVRVESLKAMTDAWSRVGKLALIGGPGAGKTTTIRRLALMMARTRRANGSVAPLPIVVHLPRWPRSQSIREFLKSHWPFQTDFSGALKTGDVVLFLDGLNEMGLEAKKRSTELRDWLQGPDSPARVLVACRELDYPALDLGIAEARLRGMASAGVAAMARAYLGPEAETFLDLVRRAAGAHGILWNEGRTGFLSTPYFLSGLLFLYQHGKTDTFPSSSGPLIRGLLQAMWTREERRRTDAAYTLEMLISDLSVVAHSIINTEASLTLSRPSFEHLLAHGRRADAATVVDTGLRLGVLREEGTGRAMAIRFEHQLFVEFFAAYKLAAMPITDEILAATRSPIWSSMASGTQPPWLNPWHDWTEVIVAAAGLGLLSDQAFKKVARTNAYLAARCARAMGELSEDLVDYVALCFAEQVADAQSSMNRAGIPGSASIGYERMTDKMLEIEVEGLRRLVPLRTTDSHNNEEVPRT